MKTPAITCLINKKTPELKTGLKKTEWNHKKECFTAILFIAMFFACNVPPKGIVKNLDTGLTTTYDGMKPEKTKMVMNNEELNHNDIPIGEQFMIINEGVTGLTLKDGKVSVGCSLKISDKNGKILRDEPDLFRGRNLFLKDSLKTLSCTVNTGDSMEWEEKYEVNVVFTDQFGQGKLENKVTIRAIDIP